MAEQQVPIIDPQTIALPTQAMATTVTIPVSSNQLNMMPPVHTELVQQSSVPSLAQLLHPATSYKNPKMEQQYITSLKGAMMECFKVGQAVCQAERRLALASAVYCDATYHETCCLSLLLAADRRLCVLSVTHCRSRLPLVDNCGDAP
jgi:hypothetical protein